MPTTQNRQEISKTAEISAGSLIADIAQQAAALPVGAERRHRDLDALFDRLAGSQGLGTIQPRFMDQLHKDQDAQLQLTDDVARTMIGTLQEAAEDLQRQQQRERAQCSPSAAAKAELAQRQCLQLQKLDALRAFIGQELRELGDSQAVVLMAQRRAFLGAAADGTLDQNAPVLARDRSEQEQNTRVQIQDLVDRAQAQIQSQGASQQSLTVEEARLEVLLNDGDARSRTSLEAMNSDNKISPDSDRDPTGGPGTGQTRSGLADAGTLMQKRNEDPTEQSLQFAGMTLSEDHSTIQDCLLSIYAAEKEIGLIDFVARFNRSILDDRALVDAMRSELAAQSRQDSEHARFGPSDVAGRPWDEQMYTAKNREIALLEDQISLKSVISPLLTGQAAQVPRDSPSLNEADLAIVDKLKEAMSVYEADADYKSSIAMAEFEPIGSAVAQARERLGQELNKEHYADHESYLQTVRRFEESFERFTRQSAFVMLAQNESLVRAESERYSASNAAFDPEILYNRLAVFRAETGLADRARANEANIRMGMGNPTSTMPGAPAPALAEGAAREARDHQALADRQRQILSTEYPILIDSDLNGRDLAAASPTTLGGLLSNAAEARAASIVEARRALIDNPASIWEADGAIAQARSILRIRPESVYSKIIDDRLSAISHERLVRDLFIAALSIGFGIASFGTGTLAEVAVAGGVGLSVYGAVDHYQEYTRQRAFSQSAIVQARALSASDPNLLWLAVDIVGAIADVGDAVSAFRSLRAPARAVMAANDEASLRRAVDSLERAALEVSPAADLSDEAVLATSLHRSATELHQNGSMPHSMDSSKVVDSSNSAVVGIVQSETIRGAGVLPRARAQEVSTWLSTLVARYPILEHSTLDADAILRILSKGPLQNVKGQLFEELMVSDIQALLRGPAGKEKLAGAARAGDALEFIPGHLIRDSEGSFTDGMIVVRRGDTLEVVAILEAKAGDASSTELRSVGRPPPKLAYQPLAAIEATKPSQTVKAETIRSAYHARGDAIEEFRELNPEKTRGLTMSQIDRLYREDVNGTLGELLKTEAGQAANDIERLVEAERLGLHGGVRIFDVSTGEFEPVEVIERSTKVIGVLPDGVKGPRMTIVGQPKRIQWIDYDSISIGGISSPDLETLARELIERATIPTGH